MSNTTRYDALLTRHLARELSDLMAGQRITALHFDRAAGSAAIVAETMALRWSLQSGPARAEPGAVEPARALVLPRKGRLERVTALPDERVLRVTLAGGRRENAVFGIVVELLPPRPNVIALDAEGRVLLMLATSAARMQTRGQPYSPPAPAHRPGLETPLTREEWSALLATVPAADRAHVLSRRVAWLSPLNAGSVLGSDPAAADELDGPYTRYLELVHAAPQPHVVRVGGRAQPYGHSLWQADARPADSLLAAFAQAQDGAAPALGLVEQLEAALVREQKKRQRILQEGTGAEEQARRLRQDADLLLAHLHALKRGNSTVELLDFQGEPRRLELDPALSPRDNATAWYGEARKRERAQERVPQLVAACDRAIRELETKIERARAGEAVRAPARAVRTEKRAQVERLPYRRFRTSGGLEVRVGRNSKSNDELTFKHAAPNDVWLHARAVGGAHVVLRWPDADANPPRRDLEQAAMLAALHSKARHSGTVPVDWTRRKYVRKPRQAPPGQVRVERVKTVFVSPADVQEDALRWEE